MTPNSPKTDTAYSVEKRPAFTPAPWRTVRPDGGSSRHRSIIILREQGEVVAKVMATRDPSNDATWTPACVEANARLIASAPVLYEALRAMLGDGLPANDPKHITLNRAVEMARAALQQATGDSNNA